MEKPSLEARLLSNENIYLATYMVDSYILNRELLSQSDRDVLRALADPFNDTLINEQIAEIKKRLQSMLDNDDDLFETSVYFKPKKYEDGHVSFRPLHTAALVDQITMVAMLQILIFQEGSDRKLVASELSRLLPASFYGNRVSYDGKQLFKPWQEQYHMYTDQANEYLSTYAKTCEYKYEVDLDLMDFFPSVQPEVLYSFITSKLPLTLDEGNQCIMRKIIRKLLLFRLKADEPLNKTEIGWYLGTNHKRTPPKVCRYVKGIPQGLPHTYFLANLYMLIVKKTYQRYLPGKALFYVDDSIVFTNGPVGHLDNSIIKETIGLINAALCEEGNKLRETADLQLPKDWYYTDGDFTVQVHSIDGKSTYGSIQEAIEASGEPYLRGLCREVSKVGFDWYSSFSDEEITALRNRITKIHDAVTSEIERRGSQKDAYQEKLYRYRKYFGYRKIVLEYLADGDINSIKKKVISDLSDVNGSIPETINDFFEKYANDNLAAIISYVHQKVCESIDDNGEELSECFNGLQEILYGNDIKHSYLHMSWEACTTHEPTERYKSLQSIAMRHFKPLRKQAMNKKYAYFSKEIVQSADEKGIQQLYEMLALASIYSYGTLVRSNNSELDRMLINAIFSCVFCYETDDSLRLAKKSRDCIEYAELRVLVVLRNHSWTLHDFCEEYASMTDDEYRRTADYSILQVIEVFSTFVGKPKWMDDLIRIHKYCEDTWKNGSKYLYFYTIHNQEHAVNLIKSVAQVVHAISKFQMKKNDYYILFAACYLHDISMVSMPHYSVFYQNNDAESNRIYSECKTNMKECNSIKAKKLLCDCSREIDEYFENLIRSRHAIESAAEIRKHAELSFIDKPTRDLIATVSEMHGADWADVYFRRSGARKELVNIKVASILLRLADLLDISRYRVSPVLLAHNMTEMNTTSRFHWISHLLTDGYSLETDYEILAKHNGESYLHKGGIVEKLTLTVNVLMPQATAVEDKSPCKNIGSCELLSAKSTEIILHCKPNAQCNRKPCPFLCRWFVAKNYYLISEMSALQQYLESLPDNFFKPSISIRIRVSGDAGLTNDVFDYLKEYVE